MNFFDRRIYWPSNQEFGVYQTRRWPKAQGVFSNPGDIEARAPSTVVLSFGQPLVGVHAQTERWRYVTPPNRKAIIVAAFVEVSRVVAGAGALQFNSIVILQRFNGAGTAFIRVTINDDAIGAHAREVFDGGPDNCVLFPGDILTGSTALGAGDGHVMNTAHLIEFNATEAVNRDFSGYAQGGEDAAPQLLQSRTSGGQRTIIRVAPGSEPRYIAEGWTSLGGGFMQRIS